MTQSALNVSELAAFAEQLADAAAQVTLPFFRNPVAVENKLTDGFDPVTEADRNAEKAIRQLIETQYPSHAISGEEFDDKTGDDFEWVIDPIDGTRAFISGMPTWGTLIGLNYNQTPILGIMDQPFTGERYMAADGLGATLIHSGKRQNLTTRPCAKIEDAILATTTPDLFADTRGHDAWARVSRRVKLTRYGGDCYNYALLASGQIDVVMEQGLKNVDIQPLIAIIEQAGGIITDWQGGPAHNGGTAISCGDRQLHTKLLALLNN